MLEAGPEFLELEQRSEVCSRVKELMAGQQLTTDEFFWGLNHATLPSKICMCSAALISNQNMNVLHTDNISTIICVTTDNLGLCPSHLTIQRSKFRNSL